MGKALHHHIWKPGIFGGVSNTTLCGRVQNGGDYNVAVDGQKVTCKLCLAPNPRNKRWIGWKQVESTETAQSSIHPASAPNQKVSS